MLGVTFSCQLTMTGSGARTRGRLEGARNLALLAFLWDLRSSCARTKHKFCVTSNPGPLLFITQRARPWMRPTEFRGGFSRALA